MYVKLVANIDNTDSSGFVWKTRDDTDKSELEKKIRDAGKTIPDTSRLVKKTDYNAKTSEIESKISDINGLAATSALTAVENKILDNSNSVKNTN